MKIEKQGDSADLAESVSSVSIAVFSYNRGRNLEVCLESITRHAPGARVVIFDDCSTDDETIGVLERTGFEVLRSRAESRSRHGSLYSNMQLALEACRTEYLLLLQDDTQIVRTITEDDYSAIALCFEDPEIAFLRCQFMKEGDGKRFVDSLVPDRDIRVYVPRTTGSSMLPGNAYCDVVLCHVSKLRAANWKFADLERTNQIAAQKLFKYMPLLGDPFLFYCPEVPSYRDRKLYLASRIVQRAREEQVVSYLPMSEEEIGRLKNRPLSDFPVAEDWLTPTLPDVKRPFVFQDYSRTWWLTALYKVESRLWRMWKPFHRLFRP